VTATDARRGVAETAAELPPFVTTQNGERPALERSQPFDWAEMGFNLQ